MAWWSNIPVPEAPEECYNLMVHERILLIKAFNKSKGHYEKAAGYLKVSLRTVQRMVNEHAIRDTINQHKRLLK